MIMNMKEKQLAAKMLEIASDDFQITVVTTLKILFTKDGLWKKGNNL